MFIWPIKRSGMKTAPVVSVTNEGDPGLPPSCGELWVDGRNPSYDAAQSPPDPFSATAGDHY